MVRRLSINMPLLDALQVPTYSRYFKDIMGNKREIPPSTVKLTEECSAAIANEAPEKKRDPGCPTIPCSIGSLMFERALCDLGASVSVMPKNVFEKLCCNTRFIKEHKPSNHIRARIKSHVYTTE